MRSTDAVIPYMWAVNVMYYDVGAGPGRVAVAVLCLRRGSHARAHRQQGSHARAHLAAGSHDVIPYLVVGHYHSDYMTRPKSMLTVRLQTIG